MECKNAYTPQQCSSGKLTNYGSACGLYCVLVPALNNAVTAHEALLILITLHVMFDSDGPLRTGNAKELRAFSFQYIFRTFHDTYCVNLASSTRVRERAPIFFRLEQVITISKTHRCLFFFFFRTLQCIITSAHLTRFITRQTRLNKFSGVTKHQCHARTFARKECSQLRSYKMYAKNV